DKSLSTGSISLELTKPISYPFLLFFDELGNLAYRVVFTMIPTLLLAIFLFGFQPPESSLSMLLFLIALVNAVLLSFAIGYLIALISFWFLTTFALEWTLGALMTVFSGTFLPIWFFPEGWAELAYALPFIYLGYV